MRRIAVTAAAFLFVVDLWAADPWKEKSYKDWSEKDIHKILNDSPWAKLIEAERGSKKHDLEAPEGAPKVSGGRGEDEEDEREEKERGGEREEEHKGKEKEELKFVVRWVSSRTLREASVRGQVLRKQISETDMDKQLPPAPDDYELAVVGTDMTSFQNADEPTLKRGTYLIGKKLKEKITASQVEIVRGPDGKRINAIVFHFPRKNTAVDTEEKEVKFVSRAGTIEIKVSFDLQKMVDKQGMDL